MTFDTPAVAKRVGARLRELRIDAEMTQSEVARRIGSHREIIGRLEKGKHLQSLSEIVRYAAALDLDIATVLVCLDDTWCTGAVRARLLVARANRLAPLEVAA